MKHLFSNIAIRSGAAYYNDYISDSAKYSSLGATCLLFCP